MTQMPLSSWKDHVPTFGNGLAGHLLDTVARLRESRVIFPAQDQVFCAFERTGFDQVKVVILGQDPYHGPGQAHGLAFSVPKGVPAPPSLRNILTEVTDDTKKKPPRPTDLTHWADQGVLLLNTLLTVEQGQPLSHQNLGWDRLTTEVVAELAAQREHLVFLLWGSKAQAFSSVIPESKHRVFKAAHPSPLSAYRGFFGCRHFSKTNAYLKQHGITPIRW